MDRFKFRAWDSGTKVMINEGEANNPDSLEGLTLPSTNLYILGVEHPERFVLIQCTGLKDSEGMLIYEGDILEHERKFKDSNGQLTKERTTVFFGEYKESDDCAGSCGVGFYCKGDYLFRDGELCEETTRLNEITTFNLVTSGYKIIGNIYKNPELLKEEV